MSRLTFATLCLAAAPAFGQDIGLGTATQPFWETDPAYQDDYGPALAPTRAERRAATRPASHRAATRRPGRAA